jgi:hypothetical protein
MPGLTIPEDNSIGTALGEAFKNAGEGPKLAITAQQAQAEIALKNAQRQQLLSQMGAAEQYNQANRAYWNAQPPPDTGSPNQAAWASAGGPIGSETLPPVGPAPLAAFTPAIAAKDQTLQADATSNFNRERNLALANAQLGAVHTKDFLDASKGGSNVFGQTGNLLQGLPQTPEGLTIRGAQLKGEFDKKPDIGKVQGNWVEIDKNGNTVPGSGGMLTADGLDATTGKNPDTLVKPGSHALKGQEAKIGAAGGPFGDPGAEKATVFRLAQKANREGLNSDEEALLQFAARQVFPWVQSVQRNPQGQYVLMSHQANEPPQLLTDALTKLDATGAPAGSAFTQGATPLAMPGASVPGVPDTSRFATTPGVGAPGTTGAGPQQAAVPGAQPGAPAQPAQPQQPASGLKLGAPQGPGESSQESARKDATAVILANNALNEFYKRFNYQPKTVDAKGNVTPGQFIDPKTGQPNNSPSAVTNVVPSWKAGVAAEKLGTGMIGQGVSNYFDPRSQDYNAISYRFVEPVIRMASGAAINPSEYAQYFNMFIPNANDSPMTASAKLDAMRDWVAAVSTTSTARGALDEVMKTAGNNPIAAQMVRDFGERARVKGTLDTPFSQLPGAGQSAAGGAPATAPATAPNKNDDVERMLGIIK